MVNPVHAAFRFIFVCIACNRALGPTALVYMLLGMINLASLVPSRHATASIGESRIHEHVYFSPSGVLFRSLKS